MQALQCFAQLLHTKSSSDSLASCHPLSLLSNPDPYTAIHSALFVLQIKLYPSLACILLESAQCSYPSTAVTGALFWLSRWVCCTHLQVSATIAPCFYRSAPTIDPTMRIHLSRTSLKRWDLQKYCYPGSNISLLRVSRWDCCGHLQLPG